MVMKVFSMQHINMKHFQWSCWIPLVYRNVCPHVQNGTWSKGRSWPTDIIWHIDVHIQSSNTQNMSSLKNCMMYVYKKLEYSSHFFQGRLPASPYFSYICYSLLKCTPRKGSHLTEVCITDCALQFSGRLYFKPSSLLWDRRCCSLLRNAGAKKQVVESGGGIVGVLPRAL